MKGFINAKIYLEGEGIKTTNLAFDGKIQYIGKKHSKITEQIFLDSDDIVVPGFIDEHIHGAMDGDCMDGNITALSTIANALVGEGTTTFLATTMTQSEDNINNALCSVKEYIDKKSDEGAKLLGVHLEGPFISLKHIGAQPKEYVKTPSIELFESFNSSCGGNIKIVTLAPEEYGASALISHLAKSNITAQAGHTDATYSDIERAIGCGLSGITHTFNVQKPLHHREIGTVGSALLLDELYTEAICDTIHLSIPAIKLLIKNKPKDKVILITDSMRAKGFKDGISELGGQTVIVKDGEARLENGALAGSVLKMNVAIKNLVEKCGVPFTDAIDFATINPATHLSIADKVGSIKQGKNADFTVLDKDFNVKLTIRDGNIVYKA
ncbi:MAG: N-acetylglucosamine-6-phosphate deacetylase [Clostridia bacterium]|nr:N-acetylglucosamine-6-phosphate deacetylase [Clostridia bacterium]